MAVKVIIIRRIPKSAESDVHPLLMELHQLAVQQPGYISGESLINQSEPEEHLVISSWESVEAWESFLSQEKGSELHGQVDDCIGSKTMYQVYLKH